MLLKTTSMDAASYALWKELRATPLKRIRRKALYGAACCSIWLTAGLWAGKAGLLTLVLVWFALFLPVGFMHMYAASAKDDWFERFAPSFYMLSPFIALCILIGRIVGVCRGMPLVPTILTGKNLVSITRDVDGGHGYLFTMASGKSVAIIRDKYDHRRLCINFTRGSLGGVVGNLDTLVMELDEGVLSSRT